MNSQKWIAAAIVAAVAVSCFAAVLVAEPADAADPPKTGHGSSDGVYLSYIDSNNAGYGIVTLTLAELPPVDSLTVAIDGGQPSAPISIPKDGKISFVPESMELGLGSHSVTVSWTGFRTVVQFTVTYQGESDNVEGITLDKTSDTVLIGTQLTLTAAIQPAGVSGYVNWTSSDEGVATVLGGNVTAKTAGTVTITAVCGNHSATCVITVKAGSSESVETEIVNNDGSTTTTTGTEITFDDGTSKKEVTEVTESSEMVKTVEIVSNTDASGRTVSTETGTVTMKDTDVVLSVTKTSVSQGASVNESALTLTVSDSGVSTSATETTADGKVTKTSVTTVTAQTTVAAGKSSLTLDAATLDKVSSQMAAVSSQISDVQPILEILAKTESSTNDVSVVLSAESLKSIADDTGADVRVVTDVAMMSFSSGALKKVCDTTGSEVSISSKVVDPSVLSDEQRAKIGNSSVFSLSVMVGNESVSNFGDGNTVKVSLPYSLKDGESASDIKVWCITDAGLEEYECIYADGLATFETSHLSLWAVGMITSSDNSGGSSSDDKDIGLYVALAFLAFALLEAGALWFLIKR